MITLKLHYTKLQFIFICWASFFAFAGVVQAQIEDSLWPTINGEGVEEPRPTDVAEDFPETSIEADRITGVRGEYMEAEGNAVIIRGAQEIKGNYLFYDQINDEVTGRENVSIKKPGVFIQGNTFKYSPSDETGEISEAEYALTESGARGEATQIDL